MILWAINIAWHWIMSELFYAYCPKIVNHTLKIFQWMLQDFQSVIILGRYVLKELNSRILKVWLGSYGTLVWF